MGSPDTVTCRRPEKTVLPEVAPLQVTATEPSPRMVGFTAEGVSGAGRASGRAGGVRPAASHTPAVSPVRRAYASTDRRMDSSVSRTFFAALSAASVPSLAAWIRSTCAVLATTSASRSATSRSICTVVLPAPSAAD